MKNIPIPVIGILSLALWITGACSITEEEIPLRLWYDKPAEQWTDALPVGNGRLGAMVFGGVEEAHIQFNEETLWTGEPTDYAHQGAYDHLETIRQLLRDGKQSEAEEMAMQEFMSVPLRQYAYQPFGDLYLEFPGHEEYDNYQRQLDLSRALVTTTYQVDGISYSREVLASHPHRVIAIHVKSGEKGALDFSAWLQAEHEGYSVITGASGQVLSVAVKDGALSGKAQITLQCDGDISAQQDRLQVTDASWATILLSAATNYVNYRDVSGDPAATLGGIFESLKELSYGEIKDAHISDYRSLYDRFRLDLGNNHRDSLPTDQRIISFFDSPDDPQLLVLYAQYGRYLLISSSRPGTHPANLQGIWNKDLDPAWGSKYTVNINTEMNYWPAELTNLAECTEPLFRMLEDCSLTGTTVAREHYGCRGWVVHHNTDLWRGAAPINHSNHGIWVTGSGWLVHHLWEHYLFSGDKEFLQNRAYPLMREAARFYSDYLVEDPGTGWLISTPSNSPENGGLVAGPTMDHQIIRSLFTACTEASRILDTDHAFADTLRELAGRITPNQVGRHGQLQEWLEDLDDPENKHRHVSHLWGMHPGKDINWETSPDLMEAARQSLLFRGDDGTGWSLAWKINFWARLLDGDHTYELIKMIFRPVFTDDTRYGSGGGSYANLFDAHPPFQIDGNFGATAGMVEMLLQSHLSYIHLLPALPTVLPEGSISGVCARGGFELAFRWRDGRLTELEVVSKAGEPCRIRYQDQTVEFSTSPGETYRFDGNLERI